MTEPEPPPVTEDELHAYVDGVLDPRRWPAVELHLQHHPDTARRVTAWIGQRDDLRAALEPHLADPVPAALSPTALLLARQASRRSIWRTAASVLLAFVLGGSGGWFLRAAITPAPGPLTIFASEAVASHLVYSADRRRPVELWAAERDDLSRWVSNRLNRPLAPPDLGASGYQFMGGRLVATTHGPAALFMYSNGLGTRLSLFVRPLERMQSLPLAQVDVGSIDGCAWVENGVGYFVVAAEPYNRLLDVSEEAKRQLDRKT